MEDEGGVILDLKIFSGLSNEPLAHEIVRYLADPASSHSVELGGVRLGEIDEKKRRHGDGELYTRYGENLRGRDVFLVQPTNQPHENDEELRMMLHTAVIASADRRTAVIPYFGYARQDKKDKPRAPVSAVRKVIEYVADGASRLLVLDVHSPAVENACEALMIPCDHLWGLPVFLRHLERDKEFIEFIESGLVVAAPDLNAGKFARGYAEGLEKMFGIKVPLVLIEKRRNISTGETEVLNVIGRVRDKNVLIVDDMIDSGGTLGDAAKVLRKRGAKRVFALGTHGVFQGESSQVSHKLTSSPVEKIYVTNSILHENFPEHPRIEIVSVGELLGEAIYRIHANESVSSLIKPMEGNNEP